MSDIFFFDDPANAQQPRDQIRIENVELAPYPDGRRVRISLRLTPFGPTDRPNLNIVVQDDSGAEVATMSVIESLEYDLALTIHLRGEKTPAGEHSVQVSLFYEPGLAQDTQSANFTLDPSRAEPNL